LGINRLEPEEKTSFGGGKTSVPSLASRRIKTLIKGKAINNKNEEKIEWDSPGAAPLWTSPCLSNHWGVGGVCGLINLKLEHHPQKQKNKKKKSVWLLDRV